VFVDHYTVTPIAVSNRSTDVLIRFAAAPGWIVLSANEVFIGKAMSSGHMFGIRKSFNPGVKLNGSYQRW
ncbi:MULTISPECIES: hypothetical protein, partial [unclassified Escherichia]|uniref:hypothetical protein n=1 Tax=unclassified Escherichia TaxID=2608889 RepID=UPI00196B08EC